METVVHFHSPVSHTDTAGVNGLKLTTGVLRPDATNYFSFPSGHTAAAFMAATLLYKEYGFKDIG